MVADMIQDHQRADAYSLLRTVNNIGVAVGPSLGGFVAAASYTAAFIGASSCLLFFSLFVLFTMKETLAPDQRTGSKSGNRDLGYGHILRDKTFLLVILSLTMVGMGSSLVFVLIGVYGKENFAISESQIGFLMAVNAMMVIFFQVLVTRITKRFSPLPVLMVGALFYAVGIGAISLGSTAWQFAICMAVLTIGELIVSPTSTSLTANLAPLEMRGRYMSFYWLAWSISHGAGPLVGGLIYDRITPQAMWLGGALWCVLGALVFLLLTRHVRRSQAAEPAAA
jgi:predicted MFS family arabinose efflux permease